ncbi:hypothetical protein ACFV3E_40780 [Streptomyces sp. NPDC059718]
MLLVDVDGVLNPLGLPTHRPGFVSYAMKPDVWMVQHPGKDEDDVPDLDVWLNPAHGPALMALPFQLIWATTWEGEANDWIGWRIGLPRDVDLPFIAFGSQDQPPRPDGTYIKTWPIVEYAAGRPFAWIDDQIGEADHEYVAEHHGGPALLHEIDPDTGLTDADFRALAEWAESLTRA